MKHPVDDANWPARLSAAIRAVGLHVADGPAEQLVDTGLAHLHFRLPGSGMLARVPKQSQMQLGADANLAYQAACFERMAPSGHTPRLFGVLPVSRYLPRGALLVEEIIGRAARLPGDLPALAQALAAIHSLPLPDRAGRQQLLDPVGSLAALLQEIDAQAMHLSSVHVARLSRARIESVLQGVREQMAFWTQPPRRLIAFDAHPGNFMIRANGDAVLVDLEKGRYGPPALDVAHATLYTSTTWDATHRIALDADAIAETYLQWQAALGSQVAGSARSWLVLRSAMWLWSVTWCAKWLDSAGRAADSGATGEDWSTQLSADTLVAHVRERVQHYLSPVVVEQVVSGFDELSMRLNTRAGKPYHSAQPPRHRREGRIDQLQAVGSSL